MRVVDDLREAARTIVAQSRAAQGLHEFVESAVVLEKLALLVASRACQGKQGER